MSKRQSVSQSSAKEVYEMKPHGPCISVGGKLWCFSCGHVLLNNTISRWVTEKGCLYDLHPSYPKQLKKAGGRGK